MQIKRLEIKKLKYLSITTPSNKFQLKWINNSCVLSKTGTLKIILFFNKR